MGISFDGTITAGAIVNALVLLVGFVVAFTRIGGRLDLLSLRVGSLEKAVSDTEGVDKRLATIEERVTNHVNLLVNFQKSMNDFTATFQQQILDLNKEIGELKRGNGWVIKRKGPGSDGLDGEYTG